MKWSKLLPDKRWGLGYVATIAILMGIWLGLPPTVLAQTGFPENPTLWSLDRGVKTATAVAGAVTLNKSSGVITSEALVTAAGGVYTLTITDSQIAAADMSWVSVSLGTATTGTPAIGGVKPGAGTLTIIIQNIHATAAFNGTLRIVFFNAKP